MIVLYGLMLLILGGALWFLLPFALRKQAELRLAQKCRDHRAIVLSYDDGPGPELTPRLLDLLARYDAKANFFVLGRNIAARPDLVERVVREGHELGSHTFEHSNAWATGPLRYARDVVSGIKAVDAFVPNPTQFRPPYGKLTVAGLVQGAMLRLTFGWWTIDSCDSWARRPIDEVMAEVDEQQGGIILMHDYDQYGDSDGAVSHVDHVLALTERLLQWAEAKGVSVLTLSALREHR